MSKISLTPNDSGTGVFTIGSPDSDTNRTLTLPDVDGALTTYTQAAALSNRNLIINGAMQVAQRGTSFTVANNAETYTLDRWVGFERGDVVVAVTQESDGPSGFTKCLKANVTSADSSLADPDRAYIEQRIEGQNCSQLAFGSSDAKQVSISFWVKSNVTSSNHSFVLANGDDDRAYAVDYEVSASGTWEYKTITIAGDTSGTWDTDNTAGMIVRFGLGVPTGGARAIAAGAWSSTGNVCGSTSAVNVLANVNNYIQITGVQLEVGSVATPFEHPRSYGDELQRCQRYYYLLASGVDQTIPTGSYYSSTLVTTAVTFPVTMRSNPTLDATSGTDYYGIYRNGSLDAFNGFTGTGRSQPRGITVDSNNAGASGTAGHSGPLKTNNASAYIAFDAEL